MGGTSELYWRGARICACMKAPLDELARITGNDFKVTPIPGFGSYQSGDSASGSTATGGGHIDIYLTGYSTTQKQRAETLARMVGFYADIREPRWYSKFFGKWLTASWASHLHMILKSCPHLSDGAKAQLAEWYAGENGLVGHDVDDGDRTYLRQTWAQYLGTRDAVIDPAPVPAKTWTVTKGQTLGGIAAALGVTLAVLLGSNPQVKDPDVIQPGQVITVPPAAPSKPTVNPAPAPTVAAPKPAPAPTVAAPKPVTSTVTLNAAAVARLYPGARNATVAAYEQALARAGFLPWRYADGYYGTATSAGTKAIYANLARKQPNGGWTPSATRPGPGLLGVLRSGYAAKPVSNPAPRTSLRVDASKLRAGVESRHVTAYQRALRAYLGSATANRLNPAGATGYYGSQTEAMTRAAYRRLGWLSGDIRYPGPGLLRVLGLR